MRKAAAALLVGALFAGPELRAAVESDETPAWALADVVRAAVANSRALSLAALGRESDRVALWAARDRYRPDLVLASALGYADDRERTRDEPWAIDRDRAGELAATVTVRIPTGGRLAYGFAAATLARESESAGASVPRDEEHSRGHTLAFVQPLLQGAGRSIDTVPLALALLDDRVSELDFVARLSRVVSQAILGYRALVRAERELEIARLSLERARQLVETNRALIEAGRMAALDLVQSEVEVANKEVALLAAENRVESARLALLDVLDVPRETRFASGDDELEPGELDRDRLLEVALENDPELAILELQLEQAELQQRLAENEALWNLDLVTDWSEGVDHPLGSADDLDRRGFSARLLLGRTLGDRDRARRIAQSRIASERARLRVVEERERLELDLDDRLRTLSVLRRQVDLARIALELAERQLEVEGEKLRVGRSSNFQFLAYENDLVVARLRELAAVFAWRDGLTLLDEAVGTTLATWRIVVGDVPLAPTRQAAR